MIPPDICDVANQILVRFLNTRGDDLCEEVCRALMAERERCAKIADPIDYPNMDDSAIEKQAYDLRETIATTIRRPTA